MDSSQQHLGKKADEESVISSSSGKNSHRIAREAADIGVTDHLALQLNYQS